MGTEDASEAKKFSRPVVSRLRQERERHAWTQSEVAECTGTTQINVSRWENGITVPSPYYRQRLGELFGKSMEELGFIPASTRERNAEITTFSGTSDPHISPPPLPIWNVPYRRNPFFTGREEILAHLYTVLRSSKVAGLTPGQAISGLGGIGKTKIAVEYAYRYRDHYQAILWVTASSRDALSADFVNLADLLNLAERHEKKQDIVVGAVKRWLVSHSDWLLILDNVDDLAMILDFLPTQGAGNVLLTTRLQALGSLAQSIDVEKMGVEEGGLFLLRRTKLLSSEASLEPSKQQDQVQAAEIVTELDGLPLALDQAGAYIEETKC